MQKLQAMMKSAIVERIAILILGIVLIGGILYKTGTWTSGYHFTDDHELIRIEYSLESGNISVWEQMRQSMEGDLRIRFRPLYWMERVAGTAIMGSNMTCWNLYKAVMGVATFYLLYLAARYLKNKRHISVLFAGIIMLGKQFTPWYRSANQENTGLFLCAIVLYLIAGQWARRKWNSRIYNILIAVAVILCGLEKESFTLMMPAFVALKFWLEYCERRQTDTDKGLWKRVGRSGIGVYISIMAAFFINIYFILFKVGTDKLSYAGFHKETGIREYLWGIKVSLTQYMQWYFLFAILLIMIVAVCCQVIDRKHIVPYIGFSVVGFGIMGIQLVLHARSGMWERYIIPFIIGYALVFVILGYRLLEADVFRRRVYVGILAVLLYISTKDAYGLALSYANDGRLIGEYLKYICESTTKDSRIVGAFADEELNVATSTWLEVNGRTRTFTYNRGNGQFSDNIQMAAVNENITDWQQADVVLCYGRDADSMIGLMGLAENDEYERMQYGNYAVVVRGKTGVNH